jgi:hypothetical protein
LGKIDLDGNTRGLVMERMPDPIRVEKLFASTVMALFLYEQKKLFAKI